MRRPAAGRRLAELGRSSSAAEDLTAKVTLVTVEGDETGCSARSLPGLSTDSRTICTAPSLMVTSRHAAASTASIDSTLQGSHSFSPEAVMFRMSKPSPSVNAPRQFAVSVCSGWTTTLRQCSSALLTAIVSSLSPSRRSRVTCSEVASWTNACLHRLRCNTSYCSPDRIDSKASEKGSWRLESSLSRLTASSSRFSSIFLSSESLLSAEKESPPNNEHHSLYHMLLLVR